jgi:2-oxo-4-hydroxy-4-carboxy-5-ureidoimidazoline decarboxylase
MSLQELNATIKPELGRLLFNCCGSARWVAKMMTTFPLRDEAHLFESARQAWFDCKEQDWLEAFSHHPKIGDTASLRKKFAATADWAAGEQAGVHQTTEEVLQALSAANNTYEQKFGFIFIVCATGKSAEEMLQLLTTRLSNERGQELGIAMGEQHKITTIRLEKLLRS